MSQWFLAQQEKVSGPLSTEEVKARYSGGQLPGDCLIWGRALDVWRPIAWWMRELPQITVSVVEPSHQQTWHFAVDGQSTGPLSRVELINELKNLRGSHEILVWTKGMKAWADLYEFHDLLDEAGINRREHPRAPISGSVVVKYDNQTMIGLLKSISPGGIGAVQLGNQLSIGQQVSLDIKSESLNTPLSLKATVQYLSDSGFYGFKFQNVNMEAKAHIMEYIKGMKAAQTPAA